MKVMFLFADDTAGLRSGRVSYIGNQLGRFLVNRTEVRRRGLLVWVIFRRNSLGLLTKELHQNIHTTSLGVFSFLHSV